MKKLAYITLVALIVSACGGGSEGTDELSKLKAEKDSLKGVKSAISTRLAEIEASISTLDTTKSLPLVTYKMASIDRFEHFFKVYGSLETDQNATIYPEISGTITSIKVKEGQRVNKGDVLVQLDVRIMQKQESELKTRLELAETTYNKQKKLWDQNIGSEMQFLQAKNNYEALKNNLEALQAQIAKGTIRAPYAGVIDEIFPKTGEVAMPGMGMIRLINVSDMYVQADISENYLGRVKKGDKVVLSVPSLGIEKVSDIERIGHYINPNNRTFKILVHVDNEDQMLKPNLVALIQVNDFSQDSAVVIPTSLILEGSNNKQYVFVLSDVGGAMEAKKTVVKVGNTYNGMALITEGLNGSEKIVDKGARSIKDGELVEVRL